MKNLITSTLLISLSYVGMAQQFAFNLSFTDSVGNVDSLTYGYDTLATNGIDPAFGETNIISVPLSSSFNVRFSDVFLNGTRNPSHQSKKQIIPNKCPDWLLSDFGASIEIDANNYPITLKWDKNLFKDSCRIGTILTDVHPGGWFDTRGRFRAFLAEKDSVVINYPYYAYLNAHGKKIGVLWIAFMDSSVYKIPFDPMIFESDPLSIASSIKQSKSIKTYPNPVKNNLFIESDEIIEVLELLDIQGKVIISQKKITNTTIDMSAQVPGLYLLKTRDSKGNTSVKKLLKIAVE
jgi:hypothetical protein